MNIKLNEYGEETKRIEKEERDGKRMKEMKEERHTEHEDIRARESIA